MVRQTGRWSEAVSIISEGMFSGDWPLLLLFGSRVFVTLTFFCGFEGEDVVYAYVGER